MEPIVKTADLRRLHRLVLLDARPGEAGRQAFAERHLAGARHVDLDRDLAGAPLDPAQGGRHPLPDPAAFGAALGRLGVEPGSMVVAYDAQGGANAAARCWWLLRAAGHRAAAVLDGGIAAAVAEGWPLASGAPPDAALPPYPVAAFRAPTASADEVAAAAADPSRLVIDVRAAERFRGEVEPKDPMAGHIPGALNVPFARTLDANGRLLPPAALRALLLAELGAVPPERVIVHCGSGVTACHTLLALERAGLPGAALYVGSWSEWCRSPRQKATG